MIWQEFIGIIAGAITTGSFLPQVLRLFKLRSAREISLLFAIAIASGVALWLVYGLLLKLWPVVIWNAATLCLLLFVLYAKVRYGR